MCSCVHAPVFTRTHLFTVYAHVFTCSYTCFHTHTPVRCVRPCAHPFMHLFSHVHTCSLCAHVLTLACMFSHAHTCSLCAPMCSHLRACFHTHTPVHCVRPRAHAFMHLFSHAHSCSLVHPCMGMFLHAPTCSRVHMCDCGRNYCVMWHWICGRRVGTEARFLGAVQVWPLCTRTVLRDRVPWREVTAAAPAGKRPAVPLGACFSAADTISLVVKVTSSCLWRHIRPGTQNPAPSV